MGICIISFSLLQPRSQNPDCKRKASPALAVSEGLARVGGAEPFTFVASGKQSREAGPEGNRRSGRRQTRAGDRRVPKAVLPTWPFVLRSAPWGPLGVFQSSEADISELTITATVQTQ